MLFKRLWKPKDVDAISNLPDDWPEIAWAKLPDDIKRRAVRRLRDQLHPDYLDGVCKSISIYGLSVWVPYADGWHFGQGMAIRNCLRGEIKDDELPGLPELYGKDYGGNWDDYYVQCLEAAAGARYVAPGHLTLLGNEIYQTCEEKGFHEPIDPDVGEKAVRLLLTIGELCEAFEAIRKNKTQSEQSEEIADAAIRLLHYAVHENIDLDTEVRRKMEINKGRPYKHGRRF